MQAEAIELGLLKMYKNRTFNVTIVSFLSFIATISVANTDSLGITIFLLIVSIVLLISSVDFFIDGAKGIARRMGIAEVIIGLTIVSVGTSLPEILVTSASAIDSATNPAAADLAFGSIFGSILSQITLILGIVVLTTSVKVHPNWFKRDGMLMFACLILLGIFSATDSGLTRTEGSILIIIYLGYVYYLLANRNKLAESEGGESSPSEDVTWSGVAYSAMIILGLYFALFSAQKLVELASELALAANVPHAIIGTTVSGIGTSLPELTIAIMAAKKSEGVAIGTLIGSNITDPTLSIGLAAVVAPMTMTDAGLDMLMYLIFPSTVVGVGIALVFMRTDYEFKKWEGGVLIAVYGIFLVLMELYRRGII